MMMSPALRKATYTTHITSSIGWIGAVIVFIVMAALALTSQDEGTVRGAYLVMAPAAWFALVPLAHASLLSGIVLSLGTTWGLMRHYWVVMKLGITVFCTVILMIYMGTFRQMAGVAADPVVDLDAVRNASPLLHASIALVLLLGAALLGVYKPFGMTPYGRRKLDQRQIFSASTAIGPTTGSSITASGMPNWMYVVAIVALVMMLLVVLLHLTGTHFQH
jgi:hypothetical protein